MASVDFVGERLSDAHPTLEGATDLRFEKLPAEEVARGVDVVLLGLPHRVSAVEAPKLLEFLWGTDTVRFDIDPSDGGCTLTLTDFIDELGKAARDGAGWHTCLDFLEAALDGAAPGFTTGERWQAVHPGYTEAFGPEASTIGPPPGWKPEA